MLRYLLIGLMLCCIVAAGSAMDDLSWTDVGERSTAPFSLPEGIAYISIFCDGNVHAKLIDAQGEAVPGSGLILEAGYGEASKAVLVDTGGNTTSRSAEVRQNGRSA